MNKHMEDMGPFDQKNKFSHWILNLIYASCEDNEELNHFGLSTLKGLFL